MFIIKRSCIILLAAFSFFLCWPGGISFAQSKLQGVHGDRSLMSKSCRACHRGMTMVISGEEGVCLDCHGTAEQRDIMVKRGYLKERAVGYLADIDAEVRKPYAHPVLSVRGAHRSNELLPEEEVNAPRHAECVDCHESHSTDIETPFGGIKGKRVGNLVSQIEQEFELCYLCHSFSANLPAFSTDKHNEFKTTNPSFHPVEGEGKREFVVSLLEPYAARKNKPADISMISCSDCHGSDEPDAPGGPHGSIYRGLLKRNYETEDGYPESAFAYALCYTCHDRGSILSNESFSLHQQHIQGFSPDQPGTSCYTCHDAHGSTMNPYLLTFNQAVVEPTKEGKLEYKAEGVAAFHGSCTLVCHGVEHNPKTY